MIEVRIKLDADGAAVDEHEPLVELSRAAADLLRLDAPDQLTLIADLPPPVPVVAGAGRERVSGESGSHAGRISTTADTPALACVLRSLDVYPCDRAFQASTVRRLALATAEGGLRLVEEHVSVDTAVRVWVLLEGFV